MRRLLGGLLIPGRVVVPCAAAAQVDDAARVSGSERQRPTRRCGPDRRDHPPGCRKHAAVPCPRRGRDSLAGELRPQRLDERLRKRDGRRDRLGAGRVRGRGTGDVDLGRRLHRGPGDTGTERVLPCGLCHGRRLNNAPDDPDMRSAPPLARARFLREWERHSLATLGGDTADDMAGDQAVLDCQYQGNPLRSFAVLNGP